MNNNTIMRSVLFAMLVSTGFVCKGAKDTFHEQSDMQAQLESIVKDLGLNDKETRKLNAAIVDGRIGEVFQLLNIHAGNDTPTEIYDEYPKGNYTQIDDKSDEIAARKNPLFFVKYANDARELINLNGIPDIDGISHNHVENLIETYWSNDMLVGVLKIFRALTLKGNYLNKIDWYNETPIYAASKIPGDAGVELVIKLIALGANINEQSRTFNSEEFKFTPLQAALYKGNNINSAKILLANGANVDVEPCRGKYSDGKTILSSAISYGAGDIELISSILSKGADVNQRNANGSTALHLATMYGYTEIMEILINNRANVDAKDSKGITPMFIAQLSTLMNQELKNTEEIIRILAENGANPNPITLREETPQIYYNKYIRLPMFIRQHFYTCW